VRRGRDLEPISDGDAVISTFWQQGAAGAGPSTMIHVTRRDLFNACAFHPRGVAGIAAVLGLSSRTVRRLLREKITRRRKLYREEAEKLHGYVAANIQPEA